MKPYRFVTNWAIEADIDKVWEIVSNFDYLGWWAGVSAQRIKTGRGGAGDFKTVRSQIDFLLNKAKNRPTGRFSRIGYAPVYF